MDMLKALLWKEWKQTRMVFILMSLTVPVSSLLINNLDLHKVTKTLIFSYLFILIWVFYSVLMAAIQFANEEETGTMDFLLSRPAHRIKIWLTKILFGIFSLVFFGIFSLLFFEIFFILISAIFFRSFLESGPLLFSLMQNPWSRDYFTDFPKTLLIISVLGFYFTGCTVSTVIKSSFKSLLVTFMVSGCLFLVIVCSYSEFYFNSSHHIYLIILTLALFYIFIKHQPADLITRITYWILPFGGLLIWGITAFKGGSFWVLINNTHSSIYFSLSSFLVFPVLSGICLSGILTSLFAFVLIPRGYPSWWRSVSCWNFLTVMGIFFTAFLIITTHPKDNTGLENQNYRRAYWHQPKSPFVIEKGFYQKHATGLWNDTQGRIVRRPFTFYQKHFMLDKENSKVTPYGKDIFFQKQFDLNSDDNRFAIYACPAPKWGLYYKWGLWAENLDTSERHFLMTIDNDRLSGKWFDKGKRFLLTMSAYVESGPNSFRITDNSYALFSFDKGTPELLYEQPPTDSTLIYIDNKSRLYFYDPDSKLISCYNSDMVKEYDITVIQEKLKQLESEIKQDRISGYGTRSPGISPGGNYMFFSTSGVTRTNTAKFEYWITSLPDEKTNKLNDINSGNIYSYKWNPVKDNLGIATISESNNNKVVLCDLKTGTSKTIQEEKDAKPGRRLLYWSGNGKHFLIDLLNPGSKKRTVSIYEFDFNNYSTRFISSKSFFHEREYLEWSSKRSHVAVTSVEDKIIWVLDFNEGKWSKIESPPGYLFMGINNNGEVFVSHPDKTQINRLTENQSEIIFQRD